MDKQNLFKLLDNIKDDSKNIQDASLHKESCVLFIDGLNLFFRNFSIMNQVNHNRVPIGGLGGFLRSLGSLISLINPTSVYIIFDGIGSSLNRKNLISGYKAGRGMHKITNNNIYDTLEEEDEAKINQISRLIQYLNNLPVKIISLDKVEADDIIAYMSKYITNNYLHSKAYIVSTDKDFLQLVDKNVILYQPREKEFYDDSKVFLKFGVLSKNFILYRMLVGDQSDNIIGVKDLGKKTSIEKFPELADTILTLDDLFEISEKKMKKHVVYSRILLESSRLRDVYKIMDLNNPLLQEEEKEILINSINKPTNQLNIKEFLKLYKDDGLLSIIKNGNFWVRDTFSTLNNF